MDYKYPRTEHLKQKSAIEMLFAEGKSVSKYPLRLVYRLDEEKESTSFQIGLTVSKKYFKKAVDRNYFKRVLRETYRLNQHILREKLIHPCSVMFFYQTKDRLSFEEINTKTIQLFEKFNKQFTEK